VNRKVEKGGGEEEEEEEEEEALQLALRSCSP
jgi:hypothetical protein